MRWSERPPAVRSQLAWLPHLHFEPRSLPVAVAQLVLVRRCRAFRTQTEPNNQKRKKKKSMNGISKSTVKTIVLVQAMQRTAPRSVFPLRVATSFGERPRALSGAVADLRSR